jgi:outer membrane protein assembly factor BamE (lipoprotein component of BamABCDE complex)
MMHRLSIHILTGLIAFAALAGCGNGSKFDRKKWSYGDGLEYPLRDDIVDDLMKNHHIKGLTFDQVIDSLGSPQRRDSLKFTYQILDNSFEFAQKGPIRKKNLIVYFNKDSVAVKFEISDHTEKEKPKEKK